MNNHETEQHEIEALSRRALFNRAGVLAGGVLVASTLSHHTARAQNGDTKAGDTTGNNGAMGANGATNGNMAPDDAMKMKDEMEGMRPLAPGDAEMRPRAMSEAMPNTPPESAIITQVENPGKNETNDVAILNFALTLEFLEAEYYSRVVEADEARPFLRGRPKDISRILSRDENTHVAIIRDAITKLGGTPIEKPNFQFPSNAFISQVAFLSLSATLEETGVSAYLGQGANVKRKDVLDLAASIYGNEARHVSLIRYLLGDNFAPRDIEEPLSMGAVLTRVKPFIIA